MPILIKQTIESTINWDYSGNIDKINLKLKKQGTSNLIDINLNDISVSSKSNKLNFQLDKDLFGIYTIIITDNATHTNKSTIESNTFIIE